MRTPRFTLRGKRDLLLVVGVSLLALLPLLAIWRKSVAPSVGGNLVSAVDARYKPVLPAVSAGQEASYYQLPAKLSPDGLFIARNDIPKGAPKTTPPSDLVVYTRNGVEMFRVPNTSEFRWAGTSLVTTGPSDGTITIYSPALPGASPAYTSVQRSWPLASGSSSRKTVSSADASLWGEARTDETSFSWSVVDTATGKAATSSVGVGTPGKDSFSNEAAFAIAPASTKWPAGVVGPVVVVAQMVPRIMPTPVPVTPMPIGTPTPTPTYSPAQKEFTQRQTKEEAQIDKLRDSVIGVDGADPTETDPTRIAQITAEVKQRSAALYAEEKRVFPAKFPTPTPAPTVAPQTIAGQTRPCIVECFDLGARKSLWKTTLRSAGTFAPSPVFSPDGAMLLLAGTSRTVGSGGGSRVTDSGVDVLSPATGLPLGTWAFGDTNVNWANINNIYFLSAPSRIAVLDTTRVALTNSTGQLRFFDPVTLGETGYLPLQSGTPTENLSPDATGSSWATAAGGNTYLLSLAELGTMHVGPFPTPTPWPPTAAGK